MVWCGVYVCARVKETLSTRLAPRYLAALQLYLEQGPQEARQSAREVGSQAVAFGLETLDLAKMHDQALTALALPDHTAGKLERQKQAEAFFAEVILPVENTHRFAQEAGAELQRLNAALDQLMTDTADAKRELKLEILVRQDKEAALKTSEKASSLLLKESRLLEQHLQDMARQLLSAQEEERRRMSLQLQDDIAQTLLGIHVRLLALKTEASANHAVLTKEITTTQRLVAASVKTIKRFAREFGIHDEN